jgi:restriction system protein
MARTIYTMEVWHEGLGKYREIRGADANVVQQKADAQIKQWNDMWARRQEAEFKKDSKERAAKEKEEKKELAEARGREARQATEDLNNTLQSGLVGSSVFNWESLKNRGDYPEPKPKKPTPMNEPPEPHREDAKYQPNLSMINNLVMVHRDALTNDG